MLHRGIIVVSVCLSVWSIDIYIFMIQCVCLFMYDLCRYISLSVSLSLSMSWSMCDYVSVSMEKIVLSWRILLSDLNVLEEVAST